MTADAAVFDIAVAGGGPAGLAAAIACAQVGLSAVVLEKRGDDLDKACGEGLLPPALAALERLGVASVGDLPESASFRSLRYVLEDGSFAETMLPAGGGRGVRRTVLVSLLRRRAAQLGVRLCEGTAVEGFVTDAAGVDISAGDRSIRCRLLVGADGLRSAVRRSAGLETAPEGGPPTQRRYGLRQHFDVAPWSSAVEVYFGPRVEAYVTPVGPRTVGVAFLWSLGELPPRVSVESLRARLPWLGERLGRALPVSRARGAGPLERRVRGRVADRVALIGDAAGYLDAITGEGLSLAFQAALSLAEVAPRALSAGAGRRSLADYDRAYAVAFRRYVRMTRLVLALSSRPAVRGRVVGWLAGHPRAFRRMIAWGIGA